MITIYDMNNHARRRLETEAQGRPLRALFDEIADRPGAVICVWDGPHGNRRRREIHPGYKAKRTPPGADIFASFELLFELLRLSKAIQVRVPGYEADDVIATLVRALNRPVHVASTDADFLQLPGVTVERTRLPCAAGEVRLYKTLVGDGSDNIPGLRGFGPAAWAKLTGAAKAAVTGWLEGVGPPPPELAERLEAHAEALRTYWRVVGFFEVPIDLIDRHTVTGTPDRPAADKILRQYLL